MAMNEPLRPSEQNLLRAVSDRNQKSGTKQGCLLKNTVQKVVIILLQPLTKTHRGTSAMERLEFHATQPSNSQLLSEGVTPSTAARLYMPRLSTVNCSGSQLRKEKCKESDHKISEQNKGIRP